MQRRLGFFLQKIIKRMQKEDSIEAVILGCTKFPLLLNDEVCPIPCLDTIKIHIHLLIDMIVEKEQIPVCEVERIELP